MEVTVYADVLMAVNFLIDYLLLLFCGRLGGRAIFRRRLLLGALIGALVSLVIFLPPLPFWAMTGVKLLSAAAMVALAFRWQGVRGFCWDVFLFFTVSFLLAGICLGLWLGFGAGGLFCRNGVTYFQVSLPVLLGTVSGAYLLLTLYDRLRRSPAGETAAVTLSRNGPDDPAACPAGQRQPPEGALLRLTGGGGGAGAGAVPPHRGGGRCGPCPGLSHRGESPVAPPRCPAGRCRAPACCRPSGRTG